MAGKLISISGIDGSGKTTLSNEIVREMKKLGVSCKYVWGGLDPKFTRFLMYLGRKLLRKRVACKDYGVYSRIKMEEIRRRKFLARIYYNLVLIEYELLIFLKVWIYLKLGRTVVCDRYVFDVVCSNLAPDLGYAGEDATLEIRKMLKKLPKPDLAFLIDLPEEVALARKNDIPSKEYLKERRRLYLEVAQNFNMEVLDGTERLDKIKLHVLKRVYEKILDDLKAR